MATAHACTATSPPALSYRIPATDIVDEQVIKKSRFITHVQRVQHKQQALDAIATIKSNYPDARHHCWAYIAGHPSTSTAIGFSDDGEPSGTAGKPILHVLQHRQIGEIIVVVVRYFGGIKLGAGGLVRAYSSSAHLAVEKLPTTTFVTCKAFSISFDYPLENNIKHLLTSHQASTSQAHYTNRVTLDIQVPESQIHSLDIELTNISAGKVSLLAKLNTGIPH